MRYADVLQSMMRGSLSHDTILKNSSMAYSLCATSKLQAKRKVSQLEALLSTTPDADADSPKSRHSHQ